MTFQVSDIAKFLRASGSVAIDCSTVFLFGQALQWGVRSTMQSIRVNVYPNGAHPELAGWYVLVLATTGVFALAATALAGRIGLSILSGYSVFLSLALAGSIQRLPDPMLADHRDTCSRIAVWTVVLSTAYLAGRFASQRSSERRYGERLFALGMLIVLLDAASRNSLRVWATSVYPSDATTTALTMNGFVVWALLVVAVLQVRQRPWLICGRTNDSLSEL